MYVTALAGPGAFLSLDVHPRCVVQITAMHIQSSIEMSMHNTFR